MTKKQLALIVLWIVYVVLNYFISPFFLKPISWIIVCLVLFIFSISQIVKGVKHGKSLTLNSILNISIALTLFLLTFYNFMKIPDAVMEKLDWKISYNRRMQVIKELERGKLKINDDKNDGIYELPYRFPIVSNGGNDIWISKSDKGKTVRFWISRGFFESPQTYFIYTDDAATIKQFEELIGEKPQNNWKLQENWYRILQYE